MNIYLIFHFKHALREAGRKVFSMDRGFKKHLKLSDYLNQIEGIMAILKALQGLTSKPFTLGFQQQRQLNYKKCQVALLPDLIIGCCFF